MRRGHTAKNSVITTSHSMLLIGSQVNVLRHDERTGLEALTGNAAHDGPDVLRADLLARFHLDVCLPMTYKDFTGHFWIFALCVTQIYYCTADSFGDFIRVARVHFLKPDLSFYGFLEVKSE